MARKRLSVTVESAVVLFLGFGALGALTLAFQREMAARPRAGLDRKPVAKLAHGLRSVQRKLDREVLWDHVDVDTTLFGRDAVRTAEESSARILFDDGTRLDLSENSLVVLDRSDDRVNVEFIKGSVFARGGKGGAGALQILSGGSRVEMGDGSAGVVALTAGKQGLEVTVAEGSARVRTLAGEASIGEGEQGQIGAGGAVSKRTLELRALRPVDGARILINKEDIKTGAPVPVSFEWSRGAGARGLPLLQIARDPAFERLIQAVPPSGDGAPVRASLPEGSYFWRVVTQVADAKTRGLTVRDASETRGLRIIRPARVRLELPEESARLEFLRESQTARFSWTALGTGAGGVERIQVSRDAAFRGLVPPAAIQRSGLRGVQGGDDGGQRVEAVFDALPAGDYFWRVVTRYEEVGPDGRGAMEIPSDTRRVQVTRLARLQTPRLLEPLSGAMITFDREKARIRLEWSPVAEAGGYRVRVAGDPSFGKILLAETALKPQWEGELQAAGTLYWTVEATHGAPGQAPSSEDSGPSAAGKFVLARSDGFKVVSPSDKEQFKYYPRPDGGEANKPEIAFEWEKSAGAASYELQVAADERFNEVLFSEKAGNQTRVATRRAPAGSPFWRVRALGEDGRVLAVSGTGRYRLAEAPLLEAPEKATPEADARYRSDPPPKVLFGWKAVPEARSYMVFVWKQDDAGRMRPLWKAEAGAQGLERELEPGNYQWTVLSIDPAGRRGSSGMPRTVIVRSPELLPAPGGLDPSPGTRIESSRPRSVPIRWEAQKGAQGYSVRLSRLRHDGTSEPVRDVKTDKNELLLPDTLPSGDYVWQVAAIGVASDAPAGSMPRSGEVASSQFSIKWSVLSAPSRMKVRLEEDRERRPARERK